MAHARELVRRRPCAALAGHVLGYRGFSIAARPPRRRLVVPDGLVKVMFGFGEPVRMVDAVDQRRAVRGRSLVNGLGTTAVVGQHTGGLHGITVLLTPPAAHRIFAVPPSEWGPVAAEAAELGGPALAGLGERLDACPDWATRFALLDEVLTERLHAGRPCHPDVIRAWREIARTHGRVRVEDLAATVGRSRRHLERLFRRQIGQTPKAAAQVARLQQALRLQASGMTWAQVAAEAGYYDQPHFDRTFTAMIGCTPTRFRADRAGSPSDDPLDFLPDRVTSVLLTG
ncbi:helix-turn-helix domain-containing protein [Streptomyces griseocarneus]|uniref:helix-turn-helix domain-containing protein n=1 Tax=Streptomyces griseocarneus TaxID=51201 RepID=UPI00167CEB26|nr:AraC family transcriptional regulator [Streptomyces griseocarneus]MBZ6477970.1 AraC family transcriptional regulator [Streptomyces griseocarneus]GHG54563.1 AraC family transcriptional regulator [Streptomyces griseocarneus]